MVKTRHKKSATVGAIKSLNSVKRFQNVDDPIANQSKFEFSTNAAKSNNFESKNGRK